jgi:uncharacterized SAM-binding protein YcdF (DUF218 family)
LLARTLISIFATPPALNLLLMMFGLLLLLRWRRTGVLVCLLSVISLWLLSTPQVSTTLARTIEAYPALPAETVAGADGLVIVVAGASHYDTAAEYGVATPVESGLVRLHYTANLHKRTGLPILLTGGPMNRAQEVHSEVLAESLSSQFGVRTTWLEKESATTWQNAANSADILLPQGYNTIVLVTQAYHMRRAAMLFETAGFTVIPAPTQLSPTFPLSDWRFWMPKADALELSSLVFHEALGLLWYRFVSPVNNRFENEITLPQ